MSVCSACSLTHLQRTILLGGSMGLSYDAVSCSYKYLLDHSNEFQAGPNHHCETLSKSAESPGGSIQCNSFWPAAHEGLTVVAKNQRVSLSGNPYHTIKVTRRCLHSLIMWKKRLFLSLGPVLGAL